MYFLNSRFCGTGFDVVGNQKKVAEMEPMTMAPDFWNDSDRAQKVMRKLTEAQGVVSKYESLEKEVQDIAELSEMAGSVEERQDVEKMMTALEARALEMETLLLFSGSYDAGDAIVMIQSGAGGLDAQDWAQMLLRMYLRFCERSEYRATVLDETYGTEAGIKSAVVRIEGQYAYGKLKSEHGTHRLVRLSPFNANNLRQTSFARVEVLPVVEDMEEEPIVESDLRVDVYRSSGAGGQSVNTTDSAVRITHIPTGIMVSCQNERSQLQNKMTAMAILRAKLAQKKIQEREEEQRQLRGEQSSGEWGSQIRSYVVHPYKMVKDHRTKYETAQVDDVLDGDISGFMEAWLRSKK